MDEEVAQLLRVREGHFRLESGHHGDRWLDMEALCLDPEPVRRAAEALADRLRAHRAEAVCGPLVEGAFVALFVAVALKVPFTYSVPEVDPEMPGLFPVRYRVPDVLRPELRGKRIAIVNDVINAGSAVRATHADLVAGGATPVAVGTLVALGEPASAFAADHALAFEALASLPNQVWTPAECPLCAATVPMTGGGI